MPSPDDDAIHVRTDAYVSVPPRTDAVADYPE